MKLKHVLNEAGFGSTDPMYRGPGWEQEPDYEEPRNETRTVVMPYSTTDNTEIKVKVQFTATDVGQGQVELDNIEMLAVILPSGKEVDADTARNILGDDELGSEQDIADNLVDYLHSTEKVNAKANVSSQQATGRSVAPTQVSAPAAAAQAEPTAA